MKITTKGQVTIPMAMRKRFGLKPHMEVTFEENHGQLILRPSETRKQRFLRGLKTVAGSAKKGLSTDEIMKLTRGED
ncbi:MAG: AbrB/MazE/SpoVT family DNA-binding domain-containing protein [Verrucomicrobiae bacterium]|nr:AbrB/MazE/SpoVT family DNA-binding domain-containing protein [Verrucomicrobiae bacterium]